MTEINLHLGDCMDAMSKMEDNAYNLAIVDPPYGIGAGVSKTGGANKRNSMSMLKNNTYIYNDIRPSAIYFNELIRVSKNQIIWGGNYFANMLPASRCYIVWDKMNYLPSMSQIELAWTSKNEHSQLITINSNQKNRFHISQKPVALYKWLLKNYAKEGDKILDTHLGSGSIAIACHDGGFSLDAWEIDQEYYTLALNRFNTHKKQLRLL